MIQAWMNQLWRVNTESAMELIKNPDILSLIKQKSWEITALWCGSDQDPCCETL